MKYISILLILLTMSFGPCRGQESLAGLSDEEILKLAREAASAEPFTNSQLMLIFLLERNPMHSDARVFLARIYGWNRDYESARNNLQMVLSIVPYHEDALKAIIDVSVWTDDFEGVLTLTEKALSAYPDDAELLYNKAKALYSLKRFDEAILVLKWLTTVYPEHSQGRMLMKTLSHEGKTYYFGLVYGLDVFNETFSPAQNASVQISKKTRWGSAIVNGNFASRFDMTDWQAEIDVYPKLYNSVYGYFNYCYSPGDLFPQHRVGAELFFPLPKSFEVSGGLRYMRFVNKKDVEFFTASIGWYRDVFTLLTRLFVTPEAEKESGFSTLVVARKVWNDPDEYLGLNGSIGFSPDARMIQTSTGLAAESIYNLKAQSVGIDWSHVANYGIIILANIRYTRQQFGFDTIKYVSFGSMSVGLRKRF